MINYLRLIVFNYQLKNNDRLNLYCLWVLILFIII
ncbi:hypothetical protein PEC331060_37800 [Pectobacterium carotovorum subsp. carotovorum]|nr:hypothetical protein PEC331060_37800 [Pectobacterium carotovorum subsp. carotovorum]